MKIGFIVLIVNSREDNLNPRRYLEIRDISVGAENAGFDSIWLYDHLLYKNKELGTVGIWECWTILSALAEATKRVELGTMVLCNQFRNPAILVKMAHTIDEVSGGRLILGLGAGWNKPEFDAFGIPFDHRVDRFEEALQIIKPLLKDGYVDFKGKYYQARKCEITPRSPRAEGPPLLIGSFGPRMMRLTARYADMWNRVYYHKPESFKEDLEKMKAVCEEEGREWSTLGISAGVVLNYPELGEPTSTGIDEYLIGSTEEIAEAMKGYEELGLSHLMFHCSPYYPEAMERLAESIALYRKM